MYLFFQRKAGPFEWELALAETRNDLVAQGVEMISAFDMDNDFSSSLSADELYGVKYAAPLGFFMDFDGDLEEVFANVRTFIEVMRKEHVDMAQCRFYFTGGRGIHIEMPMEMWSRANPKGGWQALPSIFSEIAKRLYDKHGLDTLDLRVYSSRKTRMWRVPNVKRENGLYKVQVSLEAVLNATPETYKKLCSEPRSAVPLTPAGFTQHLGLLFNQASDHVNKSVRNRKKALASQIDPDKYGGRWPLSFELILTGQAVNPDKGWNQIAVQVASFALAIGKTEDQMVADADGLIKGHQGDSGRYGTPAKRERELRGQYRYQSDNPAYTFSLGGVRSLYAKGFSSADLEWLDENGQSLTVAKNSNEIEVGAKVVSDGLTPMIRAFFEKGFSSSEDINYETTLTEDERTAIFHEAGIMFTDKGIYALSKEGEGSGRKILSGVFSDGICLISSDDSKEIRGFEWDIHLDGRRVGRTLISTSQCATKASFNAFCTNKAMGFFGTDRDVGHLLEVFRKVTTKGGLSVVATSREGVDVLQPLNAKDSNDVHIVWVSPSHVHCPPGQRYVYRGGGGKGQYNTDLWDAPFLTGTAEEKEYIGNLLELNAPEAMGKLIGFFTACFLNQIIRHTNGSFPLLQVWGEAGAGKSHIVELLSHMHYFLREPRIISSTGNTFYPLMTSVTMSASIPVVFEEFKPREMPPRNYDTLKTIFRTNYKGDSIERGAIDQDKGGVVVMGFRNTAPIVFVGEAMEAQTAIMERCVSVPLSKQGRRGRTEKFAHCYSGRKGGVLSRLGKNLAANAMASNIVDIGERLRVKEAEITKLFTSQDADTNSRMINNHAVVLLALDFLKATLADVFGPVFDLTVEAMQRAIVKELSTGTQASMSEAAKVLDTMAQMSRIKDVDFRLERNVDYWTDGQVVDIRLKDAFKKYVRHQMHYRQEILYDSTKSYIEAMSRWEGRLPLEAGETPLNANAYELVMRFSVHAMVAQGCEPFDVE